MKTILFQGDSITDCGRDRKDPLGLGQGYPLFVASRLGFEHPEEYTVLNRAVSGNRVVDVYARIKADIINLKPDVISFLIGINDVWHEISRADGVDALKFEKIYTMLLEEIRTALPQTKMILLAPYVLKGEATENTEEHPDRWNRFCMEVPKRIAAVERLGKKFDLPVIHLQEEFNRCAALAQNNSYWARDGVHPTKNGHELIARQWLSLFQTL